MHMFDSLSLLSVPLDLWVQVNPAKERKDEERLFHK